VTARPDGFVTVRDGAIVDGAGDPLLLRGVGLGNWLLPEGYMWHLSPGRESPREIEALVAELVGEARAGEFWAGFRDRFVTRDDVSRIAAAGFNHVRLPLNWRVVIDRGGAWRPDGITLVDRLVAWCAEYRLWVLLDLHGAPGGQTGTNIDDSDGRPELFEDPANRDLTVTLWRKLAARYRDEPWVLGYDLLNEPLPNEWQHVYQDDLADLYRRITAAIREVDPHHLVMYEGTHWATNWGLFTEVWDARSVLQFHRYWAPPDRSGVAHFLEVGAGLGLPVYMGEGGENNPDWLATAFQLYEDLGIGWNFWPWKKIDTVTSPCSVVPPPGWAAIVAFAQGEGPVPDPDDAWATLQALLAALAPERCDEHPEVVRALFRRAPLSLPATGFGFAGEGRSYATRSARPLPGFRPGDAVTILQPGAAPDAEPFFGHSDGRPRTAAERLTVRLEPGDWVGYDVAFPHPGPWTVTVMTEPGSAAPAVSLDGTEVAGTGGEGWWRGTAAATEVGRHRLVVAAGDGTLHFGRVTIEDRDGGEGGVPGSPNTPT
jgi:endoglucanase